MILGQQILRADNVTLQLLNELLSAKGGITEALLALTDNTTNNVSSSKHGYAAKSSSDSTQAYLGDGTWGTVPPSRPVGSRGIFYPTFTVSGDSDEFTSAFSGWTAINSGSHTVTVTQGNDLINLNHPGGDGASEVHAWVKSHSFNTNDWIEMGVRYAGQFQNYNFFGPIVSDSNSYGSGNCMMSGVLCNSDASFTVNVNSTTGYGGMGGGVSYGTYSFPTPITILRMKYLGSNNWTMLVSSDGVSFTVLDGAETFGWAHTAAYAGLALTTFGGSNPYAISIEYVRFGNG